MAAQPEPAFPDPAAVVLALRVLGSQLDDAEKTRIMSGNRVGAADDAVRAAWPAVQATHDALARIEHQLQLELVRTWRQHPLAPVVRDDPRFRGVGEKSVARLIGTIGDPAERPNPAKLWAYCGRGNPNLKRRAGMSQEQAFKLGNPRAKKQTWLIATRMLMSGNREAYDARRAATADRDWTDGHKHNDALRIVGKRFLVDLWTVARELRP